MYCNKCGNEVNEHDVFCVKCGNKLHEGDLFCSKCGSDVESAVVVADDQETKYGFIENLEGVRIKKIILAIVGLIIVGGVIAGTVMMSNDNVIGMLILCFVNMYYAIFQYILLNAI